MADQTVADVMTLGVVSVAPNDPAVAAARLMREEDVGDVLVIENERLVGIVTDRDLVVRAMAEGCDPSSTPVSEVCSSNPLVIDVESSVEDALRLMREAAVRRLPVVDNSGRPIGMVSIGDLAAEREPESALGEISTAPPNT